MISVRAAVLAAALFPAAAFAGPCDDALNDVDSRLRTGEVAADVKAQVKDMRDQAANLCQAGNESEGLDVLAEAKSILGIE